MTRPLDPANGYEAAADEFIRRREGSSIGVATVRAWAETLPLGASVLDLGCGSGAPISEVLHQAGLMVHAVEASPTLAAAYRHRFPDALLACERVEDSRFFDRRFDAALAAGLLFLLPADAQRATLRKLATVLTTGGRFLFTAPAEPCRWSDVLTGRDSESLGAEAYRTLLAEAGLPVVAETEDEGGNHYYEAFKR